MKKVLSFVLVLTLVLGSFSMAFAATPTDVAGTDWENAVVALSDLGVVAGYTDGTYQPTKSVNRAEAAKLIIAALGLTEYAEGNTASFTDLDGFAWAKGYIGYAEALGILKGVGNGMYNPAGEVTYEQVATMIVRALGYTDASLPGTWPANYVVKAKALGVMKNIAQAGSAAANRGDVAVMIYNSLGIDMVAVDNDNQIYPIGDTMANRLETGWYGKDVLLANGFYNEHFAFAEGLDLTSYYGAYGSFFINSDEQISGIKAVESTFLDGEYDAAKHAFVVDDVEYILKADVVARATRVLASGGAFTIENTVTSTGAFVLNDEDATVLSVKLNGKTITDIYARVDWSRDAIDTYAEDDFDADDNEINIGGTDYAFKTDKNGKIDYSNFSLVGVTSLDKIPEDAVVEVWTDDNYVKKLAVTTATVTGTVTKISGDKYYIDGTAYKLDGAAVALGDEGTARLTNAGKIYDWDVTDAATGNYAMVVKEGSSTDSYGNVTKVVTLFTKEGKEVEYTLKDGVTTVGATNIVTYALDAKGKIKSYTKATTTTAITGAVAKNNNRIGNFGVADGIVVFVYDTAEDEWTLSSLGKFDKEVAVEGAGLEVQWAPNAKGKVEAIAIKDGIFGSKSTLGLVNAVTGQRNANGDNFWYVEGFLEGAALNAFTDIDYANPAPVATTTTAGLQKITVDADGIVTTVVAVTAGTDVKAGPALNKTIKSVDKTNNEMTDTTGAVYGLADDAVVYVWNADDEEWVVKSLSSLKNKTVNLYQSDKTDTTGEYNIVLAW